ncbi:MAG: cation diffusion facilitator family transporter [Pseudohongiellaceae bacterium]
MSLPTPKQEAVRVTLIGMYLDLVLGAAKIVGGVFGSSYALIADGIHSLSDAATDIFVLVVSHFAHDAPDQEHPYGHGRFEAIGTVFMGMVLFAIASIILFDSVLRLINRDEIPVPARAGLLLAAASIAGKEWIYHYTMRTANKLNSSLLRANAWHSRSDAISSIAVLIGLLGAQQGLPWLDVVAAIFVALIIAKIGFELCLDALKELVDTAIPVARQQQIRDCIMKIQGINEVHSLRSRKSGTTVLLEAEVLVNPRISVSEAHRLAETVRLAIIDTFTDINDVIIHVDPEYHDPGNSEAETAPPLREEIVNDIKQRWQEFLEADDIRSIDLHYLNNKVEVELHLRNKLLEKSAAKQLAALLRPLSYISKLRIYCTFYETAIHDESL